MRVYRSNYFALPVVLGLVAVFVFLFAYPALAQDRGAPSAGPRIPAPQGNLNFGIFSSGSTAFVTIPGTAVTVALIEPKRCVVRFSSEVSVTPGDRVDIRSRVGAGACSVNGPEFAFKQNAGNFNPGFTTETVQHIINLPAGFSTVQMCARLATPAPGTFTFFFKTTTIECITQ